MWFLCLTVFCFSLFKFLFFFPLGLYSLGFFSFAIKGMYFSNFLVLFCFLFHFILLNHPILFSPPFLLFHFISSYSPLSFCPILLSLLSFRLLYFIFPLNMYCIIILFLAFLSPKVFRGHFYKKNDKRTLENVLERN